jgi:hypothetical protein
MARWHCAPAIAAQNPNIGAAGQVALIQSRTKLVHRTTDAAGRIAFRHKLQEVLEASQGGANAIEALVHHRSLSP